MQNILITTTQKLKEFDLDENEIKIYICLLQNGPLTFLQIARKSIIHRTSVYRAVERLEKKKLSKVLVRDKKILIEAADPEIMSEILNADKQKILKRERILPNLLTDLNLISKIDSTSTQLKYYKGISGIKQLLWSTTKKKNQTLLTYGYNSWSKMFGIDFTEDLLMRHVENRILHYELNNKILTGDIWTNVTEFTEKYYYHKYVSPEVLEIHHDLIIAEDRIIFDTDYEGDIFGIEIVNREIARTQSQLYWLAWKN
jgi:sugar-specific transcriptional regulator TrmB